MSKQDWSVADFVSEDYVSISYADGGERKILKYSFT